MANITAQMVAKLREITNSGMMECKKALVETNGDIDKAIELIRIKSGTKASKMADRIAAEGIVAVYISEDCRAASLVEINCETDFVAKDINLINFTNEVAKTITKNHISTIEQLLPLELYPNKTVEQARSELVATLGENISIRRFKYLHTDGCIASYIHGKKIGVLVELSGSNHMQLGKDIAMHIAANKPICVSKNEVSAVQIEQEKNIYIQQASQSGKPAEIVAKMVDGRINKYLSEITLLGQAFVKNQDITVEQALLAAKTAVKSFTMFVVGEGIEKKIIDYASEVASVTQTK